MVSTVKAPLKLPPFIYDASQNKMVGLAAYDGRVCIMGISGNNTFEVLYTIDCADLTVNWPDPVYITVPSFINVESLDVVVVLSPSSVDDTTLISQMEDLFS